MLSNFYATAFLHAPLQTPELMPTSLSRAFLAGALFLGLSACQGKSELALDRPYSDMFAAAPDTFTQDMADIKQEHSLDEVHWQHLRMYPAIASGDKRLVRTGITYRQASELVEKYNYSAEAQKQIGEEARAKGIPDAPPLVE